LLPADSWSATITRLPLVLTQSLVRLPRHRWPYIADSPGWLSDKPFWILLPLAENVLPAKIQVTPKGKGQQNIVLLDVPIPTRVRSASTSWLAKFDAGGQIRFATPTTLILRSYAVATASAASIFSEPDSKRRAGFLPARI